MMRPTEGTPVHYTSTPLIVFSDDWARHPSSSQHLIRHVLARRRVIWVNTIGTRRPRLDLQSAKRILEKLSQWRLSRSTKAIVVEPNAPTVVGPLMWPSFGSSVSRRLNRHLLVNSLLPSIEALPERPIAITTLPIMSDLIGFLPAARWIYYCVDDFANWPGYDGATMLRMEAEMVNKVNRIVAVSETLVAHFARLGKEADLLTHGVDVERWHCASKSEAAFPLELAGLEPPFIVFWGSIDRRMDVSYVKAVAASINKGTVVLLGPQDDPDSALFSTTRVAARSAVPFNRLPAIAQVADALVMPYADIPATRAMQPLKLKEYLATDRPVIVRDLPSTRPWATACDVCDSAEAFAQAVQRAIAHGLPPHQREARRALDREGWAQKALEFERMLDS
jgi:glycosyltransferase involved in cell wall biosynthesis